jgi:hypothetical protein
MPLELGVWRVDQRLVALPATALDLESRLEDLLDKDITIANPGWFIIGRQIETGFGSRPDLLAIDQVGNLVVLELKRDQTPREVIAQVLEYGAWVAKLTAADLSPIYRKYIERFHTDRGAESLDQAFCKRFGARELPEDLNQDHELVVVASQFDATSERIVAYLAEVHEVAINAIFFRVFKDAEREYLVRAWLRDPSEVDKAPEVSARGEWNQQYYVSYGGAREWEEARKYGFIGGGGGRFYSRTLEMLSPNDRVWVNIPGTGYVGVGVVQSRSTAIDDCVVEENGKEVKLVDLKQLQIAKATRYADDPEKAEFIVRVQWIKTVPASQAVRERGLFGNQNTVARPRVERWRHTIERLKQVWGISG